jgi:CMP-2-keto-3-deoxyoctulosonic acid synthetase
LFQNKESRLKTIRQVVLHLTWYGYRKFQCCNNEAHVRTSLENESSGEQLQVYESSGEQLRVYVSGTDSVDK